MFVFSEVCVRHKCHRDSTEEILLAWSSLCCWRAGGARLRVFHQAAAGIGQIPNMIMMCH